MFNLLNNNTVLYINIYNINILNVIVHCIQSLGFRSFL